MSLHSLLTDRRFSLAGEIGLVADEAWRCKSCRHQLGVLLGKYFKVCGTNGPRLEMGQWLNSDCQKCLAGVRT